MSELEEVKERWRSCWELVRKTEQERDAALAAARKCGEEMATVQARAEKAERDLAAARAERTANLEAARSVRAERDEARAESAALRARCEALAEALREAMSDLQWMSGSADFSPEGQAHVGWVKVRENLDRYISLLAAPAPEVKT